MLPGIEGKILPDELRTEILLTFDPIYQELVLNAKPGLAQSTGITIVHLVWLEILDQIELSRRAASEKRASDPLNVLKLEPVAPILERHLRVVHSKLNASDLPLRLKKSSIAPALHRIRGSPLSATSPPRDGIRLNREK